MSKSTMTTRMLAFLDRIARALSSSRRRNHGFDEGRGDRFRRLEVDRPIQSDDAAERGQRISSRART
jgi:hypothetical protein